ncbi:MAG: type IV pilus secretin PilQ [Deltaproteobacteria bacterium]|nr:type IV pilus secretin PilQ [Deltaproteobacteria bacterium]
MSKSRKKASKMVRVLFTVLTVLVAAGGLLAAPAAKTNQIHNIFVNEEGRTTVITVKGTVRPMYTAFKLSTPKRLVLDLANSKLKGVPALIDQKTGLIRGVAVSEFTSGNVSVSRIMVNFQNDAAYRVKVNGNNLVITLNGEPLKSSSKSSDEQVISLASANQKIEDVKKDADERISKAEKEAFESQSMWRSANAEINNLKSQSKIYQSRLEEAQLEVEKAKKELSILSSKNNSNIASKNKDNEELSKLQKDAERQIAYLKTKIKTAESVAEKERVKRNALEKKLHTLESDLIAANLKVKDAVKEKDNAIVLSEKMKDSVKTAFIEKERAKKDASDARTAQKEAELAYKNSSKEDKDSFYKQLQEKSKDTVTATKQYLTAKNEYEQLDKKLENVLGQLKKAERDARSAENDKKTAQQKIETLKSDYTKQVASLQKEIEKSQHEKDVASLEKDKAIKALEIAKQNAASQNALIEKRAEQSIKEAKKRVELAKEAAVKAEKNASSVMAKIEAVEKQLEDANKTIIEQKEKIALLEKEKIAASEKEKIALLENAKIIASEKEKVALLENAKIAASAKEKVALLENAKIAADAKVSTSKKLTQEELRQQRLKEMNGGKTVKSDPVIEKSENKEVESKSGNRVADIKFINRGGIQKVVIKVDGELNFSRNDKDDKNLILELDDTALLPALERKLDVRDFGGSIKEISSFKKDNKVFVTVKLLDNAIDSVETVNGSIEWTFKEEGNSEKLTPMGNNTRVVQREDAEGYAYSSDRTAAYSTTLAQFGRKKKSYTGRHIDLDFKNADIHNILRLLSDVGHVNIVTSNNVSGTVTIRMRDVPWDQALDVILQAKQLGQERTGNLIRIAPSAVLEAEYEKAIERMKTNKSLQPLETRLIPVSFATAAELSARAKDLISDRGKLSVDKRTNVIIARDVAEILDQIEALIRNLDTQTPQVLIEGRIVEATSTYAREIGIQWGGDFTASAATGNPTGLAFPSSIGLAGGATDNQAPTAGLTPVAGGQPNPNFAVNLPAPAGTGSGGALGIALGSIANNANLNLRLSAMEEEGTLRILSSPKILTLDNRQAHIEQGTMIPYSRVSASGVQTAFKEAKLNLTVTPHVTADGSVLLALNITRNEPDFNNKGARGDPTILKREAETELLVNDGHTAVIGGIFTRNTGKSYKKVPFFGDIPILGWLFKTKSNSDKRSEMLIFITPTIVNRAESIGQ